MKFRDLTLGTDFRFDREGLPNRPDRFELWGMFRKVAEDGAVRLTDWRQAKWYVPPKAKVVQVEPPNERPGL